jgi:hypothetical protein
MQTWIRTTALALQDLAGLVLATLGVGRRRAQEPAMPYLRTCLAAAACALFLALTGGEQAASIAHHDAFAARVGPAEPDRHAVTHRALDALQPARLRHHPDLVTAGLQGLDQCR